MDGAQEQMEHLFLSTGKPTVVDVGFALPSSGQNIFIPPIATVVVRKKAGLTCLQECGNCKYIVRRLCVDHCTVKCNCTSQPTQLSTALPSPFSQGPFAQEQIHSPLPCLAATLLFPFLITKWLGLALLLVRANDRWQSGGVNFTLNGYFARDRTARADTCVSLCSEETGRYCPLKRLFNLRYVHQSKRFAPVSSPLPSLTHTISKLYSLFQQRRDG